MSEPELKDSSKTDPKGPELFRVTRLWLVEHQTNNGAWTRDQLQALGIGWPPLTGWMLRVMGTEITIEAKARFEAQLFVRAPRVK